MAETTIFNSPILSFKILVKVFFAKFVEAFHFIRRYLPVITLISAIIIAAIYFEGPHQEYVDLAYDIGKFFSWWLLLGIASSVGLGTGLHTFMLYLGPYIVQVTLVAYECNAIPEILPSRWNYQVFGECPDPKPDDISFWTIVWAVQLESFIWGVGTAIGELPPYFVARAARMANKKADDLAELENEDSHWIIAKGKKVITSAIVKNGFITVLLCASIPNPLFDLAGLLCGHFGISFWTFFGAAVIGKAFIKVHIQLLFTILLFAKHKVEYFLSIIEANLPFMKNTLSTALEKQKMKLHSPDMVESKTIIGTLWEIFIFLMISAFIVSILNSIVQNYLEEQQNVGKDAGKKPAKKSGAKTPRNRKRR